MMIEAQLLAYLARQYAEHGDAPVLVRDFCAQSGHAFEVVRPVVKQLFAQDLVNTFIGNEHVWLTLAGIEQAQGLHHAPANAEARALLTTYAAAVAGSADPRAAFWSLALRELAADEATLGQLQVLLKT